MRKALLAISVLGSTLNLFAQNCNGAPPPAQIATRDPFAASFYYGNITNDSYNLYFDLDVQTPVDLTAAIMTCYDQGVGNPVVPNQVGGFTTVNVWTRTGSRVGFEASNLGWTQVGSGTLTVVAWNGESPLALAGNVPLPAGITGVCLEVLPSVAPNSPSPGGMHCLGVSPNPTPTVSDPFMMISNQGIQQTGWTAATPSGVVNDGINLKLNYTPSATAGLFTTIGEGCYFRSRGFYQVHTAPITTNVLENTSLSFLPSTGQAGPNYTVVSSGLPYVAPSGTTRNSVPSGAVPPGYTAGSWDDSLDTPVTLPFTFNYPGGMTNDVTACSNGHILLANVTNGNRAYGYYGALADLRDQEARICAFWSDLDLEPTSPTTGGLYYSSTPTSATFTWHNTAEWTAGNNGPLSSFSITLYSSGQVDIVYGDLNIATAGNDALTGFHDGLGRRLPTGPISFTSPTLPYVSGDGAIPPILTMNARPVLGTMPKLITTNLSPNTFFQIVVASLGATAPTSLAGFGMGGCFGHLNNGLIVAAFLKGRTTPDFEVDFNIPNFPGYQGIQFFFQMAPLTSGLNAAGIITSNALCVKLGQ